MNLYLVSNPDGLPVWVAFESQQKRMYTYVANTRKFHLNAGLYEDFYFDHRMIFQPLDVAAAEGAILSGLGLLDERRFSHIVARYHHDPDALSPESVFGHLKSLATSDMVSAEPNDQDS